jgi:hypothetical protein
MQREYTAVTNDWQALAIGQCLEPWQSFDHVADHDFIVGAHMGHSDDGHSPSAAAARQ